MASNFGDYISGLVDSRVRPDAHKRLLADTSFTEQTINPAELLEEELVDRVLAIKKAKESALDSLHSAVRDALEGNSMSWGHKCCSNWRTQYDERFGRNVNLDDSCYVANVEDRRLDSDAKESITVGGSAAVTDAFVRNLANEPSMSWQMFASESATYRIFPGVDWPCECSINVDKCVVGCDGGCRETDASCNGRCTTYDPRTEPWYVSAALGRPRDVVVLLESSDAMSNGWEDIKRGVLGAVGTLTAASSVTVLTFDTVVSFPRTGIDTVDECRIPGFPAATAQELTRLAAYLDSVKPKGGANYEEAFKAAYSFLAVHGRSDDTVILFVASGAVTAGSTTNLPGSWNGDYSRPDILVFHYGDEPLPLLDKLTTVTGGYHFGSSSYMRGDIPHYYTLLSAPSTAAKAVWTQPLCNERSGNTQFTVSRAVYDSSNSPRLYGVVAIDVGLAELFEPLLEASVHFDSAFSYAFAVDRTGAAIVHPLLADPFTLETTPSSVDITLLESGGGLPALRDSMVRALDSPNAPQSGFVNVTVRRMVATGDSDSSGFVTSKKLTTSYEWMVFGELPYVFCMVVAHDDLAGSQMAYPYNFKELDTYHRIDLDSNGQKVKKTSRDQWLRPDAWILEGSSTFKLAPVAFLSSYDYLVQEETKAAAASINEGVNAGLTAPIRSTALKDIHLTSAMDAEWAEADSAMSSDSGSSSSSNNNNGYVGSSDAGDVVYGAAGAREAGGYHGSGLGGVIEWVFGSAAGGVASAGELGYDSGSGEENDAAERTDDVGGSVYIANGGGGDGKGGGGGGNKDKKGEDADVVMWRYIGTANGVLRLYPGSVIAAKRFDPRTRPWYTLAASYVREDSALYPFSPSTAVTTPYLDAVNGNQIVSFSRAIQTPKSVAGAPTADRVAAVAGLDMRFIDLYRKMGVFADCPSATANPLNPKRCYVIDANARFVVHSSFIPTNGDEIESLEEYRLMFENVFIGKEEAALARALIHDKRLFYLDRCLNTASTNPAVNYFYRYNTSAFVGDAVISGKLYDCGYSAESPGTYHVARMRGTNLFLVIMDDYSPSDVTSSACRCTCACEKVVTTVAPCVTPCTCTAADSACTPLEEAGWVPAASSSPLRACPAHVILPVDVDDDDFLWLIPVVIGGVAIVGGAATGAYVYYKKTRMGVSVYYYIVSFLLHAPIQYMARMGIFKIRRYARLFPRTWEEVWRFRLSRRRTSTSARYRNMGPY